MQGLNAIVLETHIAILIIDRRCYQRIGYRHTPMCPSWVVTVVVVVVGSSGLTYYRILQTVQWTAHIGSLEIFDNDSVDGLSMVGFIFHTP